MFNFFVSTSPPKVGMFTLASTLNGTQFDEDDESGPPNSFYFLWLIFAFSPHTKNATK